MKSNSIIILAACSILTACSPKEGTKEVYASIPIVNKAIGDTASVYFADYKSYPENLALLPIGVFDSGTGGLTVLEAFLELDMFNNKTGEESADGVPDFAGENFTYLADQANMPYGNYSSAGKLDYFRELVVKDALFLTKTPNRSKIVVIACNTATAYGLPDVEDLLERGVPSVSVTGVINAGVNASLDKVSKNEDAAIGVMATVGTIASKGYQKTISTIASERGYKGNICVVSQPGLGFAEAVDMEKDFIDKSATKTRDNYRGPVIGKDSLSIDIDLLDRYNFNFADNSVLFDRNGNSYSKIQLNSASNYARFHLVNLIENHRVKNGGVPLKNIILGCTHYPFVLDTLLKVVAELRAYKVGGEKIYDKVLAPELTFIDPAIYTAKEVYLKLRDNKILASNANKGVLNAFISVPVKGLDPKNLDENGNLTYDFKYGREALSEIQTVEPVPFSRTNINPYNLQRIQERLPKSWQLIEKIIK